MIGEGYWATGIVVSYSYAYGRHRWGAVVRFYDNGFLNDDPENGIVSTQGELATRYKLEGDDHVATLTAAVNAVYKDAKALGINFNDHPYDAPHLYADGDESYQVMGPGELTPQEVGSVVAEASKEAQGRPWAYTTPSSGALRRP